MVGVSQGVGGKRQSAKCNGVQPSSQDSEYHVLDVYIKITDRPINIEKNQIQVYFPEKKEL